MLTDIDADYLAAFNKKNVPAHALWSPDARAVFDSGSGRGLVDEHVVPAKVQLEHLQARWSDHTNPESVRRATEWVLSLPRAVITKAEDRQLDGAGVRQTMPPGVAIGPDSWARYETAGLDTSDYVTIADHQREQGISETRCEARKTVKPKHGFTHVVSCLKMNGPSHGPRHQWEQATMPDADRQVRVEDLDAMTKRERRRYDPAGVEFGRMAPRIAEPEPRDTRTVTEMRHDADGSYGL